MRKRIEIVSSFYDEIDEDGRLSRSRQGQLEYATTMLFGPWQKSEVILICRMKNLRCLLGITWQYVKKESCLVIPVIYSIYAKKIKGVFHCFLCWDKVANHCSGVAMIV